MKNYTNNTSTEEKINKQKNLNPETQKENEKIRKKFQILINKEIEIKEEIKLIKFIKNYENELIYFEEDLEKKNLEIFIINKKPILRIKGDYGNNFDTSEKYKEESEKLKNIFEEYKKIAKKLSIDEFTNLSFLENKNIFKIIENENVIFLKEFIKDKIRNNFFDAYKFNFLHKSDFLKNNFGFEIDFENLDRENYLRYYDFLKDKININQKIIEVFNDGFTNYELENIFIMNNEELSNLVKNYLIEKQDFENIYKYLGEFEVDENLFEDLKKYLLGKEEFEYKIFFYEDYKNEKQKLTNNIIKSLNYNDFLAVYDKIKFWKSEALDFYLHGKEKEERKNILQKIYEKTYDFFPELLEKYDLKLDYKENSGKNVWLKVEKYFNNIPIKNILLQTNIYFENGEQKERIFSEEELKILDRIIEEFEGYNNIMDYLLFYFLNHKKYEELENILENEKIIKLLKEITTEAIVENGIYGKIVIGHFLKGQKVKEENLEKILEKIKFIKQNEFFIKIENKPKIIEIIFKREIKDIENFLKEIYENNLLEYDRIIEIGINGESFLELLKEEKEKANFIKKIKDSKDFFYEEFGYFIQESIKDLNLKETKDFLKNIDKKIQDLKQNYDEYIIIKTRNKKKVYGKKTSENYLEYFEKALNLMNILEKSKSTKVKDLAENIFDIIIETENPEEILKQIEEIFIENKLPFTVELFRIFSILYSEETVLKGISEKSSPYLQALKSKGHGDFIYTTFFKDLLKTHIYSGNRSLKKFLQENLKAKEIYKKYENGENLTEEEKSFLYQNTLVLSGIIQNQDVKIGEKMQDFGNFEENINEILKNLQLKNISEVFDFFENKFLKGTGFENSEQILKFMETHISEKNEKSKNLQNFEITENDFVKGFEAKIYHLVGNNGFVARDFLGTEGESDATPFDIDLIKVGNESFDEIINSSTASNYGNTFAVIKSGNAELFESSIGNTQSYKNHNFEVFKTGALGENHYGIRTGFPTSLIDFFVHKSKNTEETYNFFYSIAKSGIYIPVIDENKNIVFSYEDFENFRKIFAGNKEFSQENISIYSKNENPNILSRIIQNYPQQEEFDEVQNFTNQMYLELENILQKFGIEKRKNKEKIGYEMQSTGSTGRNTFLPGDNFDFDLNIKLDEESYNKIKNETSKFLEIFEKDKNFEKYENIDGNGESKSIQFLKLKKIINGKEVEVDLLFSKLTEDNIYDTNKTLEEKFENIKQNYGDEAYKNVIANIRTAKQFLKENGIYKKADGGLGGVGVETWILNNNGSFEKAVKSFLEASLDENGETLNFSDFKKKYFIYSAGENIKGGNHDKIENFIFKIGETGYFKMLEALKKL